LYPQQPFRPHADASRPAEATTALPSPSTPTRPVRSGGSTTAHDLLMRVLGGTGGSQSPGSSFSDVQQRPRQTSMSSAPPLLFGGAGSAGPSIWATPTAHQAYPQNPHATPTQPRQAHASPHAGIALQSYQQQLQSLPQALSQTYVSSPMQSRQSGLANLSGHFSSPSYSAQQLPNAPLYSPNSGLEGAFGNDMFYNGPPTFTPPQQRHPQNVPYFGGYTGPIGYRE